MSELGLRQKLAEQGLLDRFSERAIAWAEQGVEWIEIEGEAFTLISQLEKLKGAEPGDFQKNAGLFEAYPEKKGMVSEAHQRLLRIGGVRKATIPTVFSVDGAFVLHCGGPQAKVGITGMVRRQRPDWVRAQYLLANMEATLAYLGHGCSEISKETRNLTIGTTIDVGKAAAQQPNAPIATAPYGDPVMMDLLVQIQERAANLALQASQQAGQADAKADKALVTAQQALSLNTSTANKRKTLPQAIRSKVIELWHQYYKGECPCCHKPVSGEQGTMEVDHFWNHEHDLTNLWYVCKKCNHRMGKPGPQRQQFDKQRHATWLDRCGLEYRQADLFHDAA